MEKEEENNKIITNEITLKDLKENLKEGFKLF